MATSSLIVRNYKSESDYDGVAALYQDTRTFGGQFDIARDSAERLAQLAQTKPGAILVAEMESQIVGTATLYEDGRSAWLYRFAVARTANEREISEALWNTARNTLARWGHSQVLVYAPLDDTHLAHRYTDIGFTPGGTYRAFWQDIS